mgnify:FL=1
MLVKTDKLYALTLIVVIGVAMAAGIILLPHNERNSNTQIFLHSNGLELLLSINSSDIKQGGSIAVNISLINILHSVNLVSAGHSWIVSDVSLGPCNNMNYPVGIAVFRGYYTYSNVSNAKNPLMIFPHTLCPLFIVYIRAYQFYPYGSSVSGEGGLVNGTYYVNSYIMSKTFIISGYYVRQGSTNSSTNSVPIVFNQFNPGVYTVVGADEWGGLVILHFYVN